MKLRSKGIQSCPQAERVHPTRSCEPCASIQRWRAVPTEPFRGLPHLEIRLKPNSPLQPCVAPWRTGRRNPYDNALAESFMCSFKCEEVYRNTYRDLDDAVLHMQDFLERILQLRTLKLQSWLSITGSIRGSYIRQPCGGTGWSLFKAWIFSGDCAPLFHRAFSLSSSCDESLTVSGHQTALKGRGICIH
jgi:hypothetical protein